jgi:hypothetical protein
LLKNPLGAIASTATILLRVTQLGKLLLGAGCFGPVGLVVSAAAGVLGYYIYERQKFEDEQDEKLELSRKLQLQIAENNAKYFNDIIKNTIELQKRFKPLYDHYHITDYSEESDKEYNIKLSSGKEITADLKALQQNLVAMTTDYGDSKFTINATNSF